MNHADLKRILLYYPIRYYACAFIIAFALLSNIQYIKAIDGVAITTMLDFFQISSHLNEGNNIVIEHDNTTTMLILPTIVQILFLIFFTTIAISARTSLKIRGKIILFGALVSLSFIFINFLAILTFATLDMLNAKLEFRATTLITTLVGGSLLLETLLFSTITLPTRTKIRRIVKRRYTREYLYLGTALGLGFAAVYAIFHYVGIDIDSPFTDYVHLILLLNMSHILFASFFISNVIYEVARPQRLRKLEISKDDKPFSISFLIPANNEERIVGRCIASIDRAAAKYGGETEIIVVNDGSTDNTEKVIAEAMQNLKYAKGKYFTIPNSGKGYACALGLTKTTCDIVFRADADSVMDENALGPMMRHFKDPEVGSVCAWIFPLNLGEKETTMIKIQNVLNANYRYNKRAQDLFDGIIVQPGCSTAFRRDVIINSGGWVDNIFGEDGEITNRVGRLGYRGIFEPNALVYTEHPNRILSFMQQRARWSVAFYHSRNRNLRLLKEFKTPRSIIYLWNIVGHGIGFAKGMIWPYFAASIATGVLGLGLADIPLLLLAKLAAIQASITLILLVMYSYRLHKVNKTGDIKYFPFLRGVNLLLNLAVKPLVLEILLNWSPRWKKYSTESFKDLRREVRKNVDPLYPDGSTSPQAAQPATEQKPEPTSMTKGRDGSAMSHA